MQRTVYNVWGREVRSKEEANARAAKALADNPKIKNLHIEIIEKVHHHWAIDDYSVRFYYQARWYDPKVAAKAKRAKAAAPVECKHECNCEYCPVA